MKTIYKYKLEHTRTQSIEMIEGSEILSVDIIHNEICIWTLCDPSDKNEHKIIHMYGTGQMIDETLNLKYIGSVKQYEGVFIWHVFENIES